MEDEKTECFMLWKDFKSQQSTVFILQAIKTVSAQPGE